MVARTRTAGPDGGRTRQVPGAAGDARGRRLFDQLRTNKKLKKPNLKDLLIACIALAHDATLVTRNTKDFQPIPNLKLINWAD